MLRGASSELNFKVNGSLYLTCFLLANAIYPRWSIFMQVIHKPKGDKRKHFANQQDNLKTMWRCASKCCNPAS
jgi:hypothetical protein